MSEPEDRTQIYLITPPDLDLEVFPDQLAAVLDAAPVACLRLRVGSEDADRVARAADAVRVVAHARDVPLVLERHLALIVPHGLDGIHLPGGSKGVRKAREELGEEAIVGAYCGASRHDGMTAGETGADYVSFGPVSDTGLGAPVTEDEMFAWWSEVIEVPVVAEGGLITAGEDPYERIRTLAPIADFLAFGEDLWRQPDPAATLKAIAALL